MAHSVMKYRLNESQAHKWKSCPLYTQLRFETKKLSLSKKKHEKIRFRLDPLYRRSKALASSHKLYLRF